MKTNPEKSPTTTTAVFRTGEGDFNVSLFSTEGKLKFKLAQKAIIELKDLMDQAAIRKEAIASLHSAIQEVECIDKTKIDRVRARTETGQYKGDDKSTPDVNEAYIQIG
tara:strand:- start:16 stop:342 length:327 start_codon:yes stop_codon:yes gene_type:complete